MSVDRSLKVRSALSRHRNVLTRAERISKLKDEERWIEEESVFGLPKVANRKSHSGKKEKAAKAEGEAEVAATGVSAEGATTDTKSVPEAGVKTKEKQTGKAKD